MNNTMIKDREGIIQLENHIIEDAMRAILSELGEDITREGLL